MRKKVPNTIRKIENMHNGKIMNMDQQLATMMKKNIHTQEISKDTKDILPKLKLLILKKEHMMTPTTALIKMIMNKLNKCK